MKELKLYLSENKNLSIRHQSELLDLNRSSVYCQPVVESDENLHLMELMDNEYLKHPTHGFLQMQDFLISQGLTTVLPVSFF